MQKTPLTKKSVRAISEEDTERVRDLVEEVLGDYTGIEHPDPNSEHSVQEVEWRNATELGVECKQTNHETTVNKPLISWFFLSLFLLLV